MIDSKSVCDLPEPVRTLLNQWWSKQLRYGWIPFVPAASFCGVRGAVFDIVEEGYNPVRPGAIRPKSLDPGDVFVYVFETVFAPLHVHAITAELTAIEELLDSKLFVRPTAQKLPWQLFSAGKYFPLQRHTEGSEGSCPPAFYAMIYPVLEDADAATPQYLTHRQRIAQEAALHLLHLRPSLEAYPWKQPFYEDQFEAYRQLVKDGQYTSTLGPDAKRSVLEASLLGFLILLCGGFRSFRSSSEQEIRSRLAGRLDKPLVDLMCKWTGEYATRIPRPRSLQSLNIAMPIDTGMPAKTLAISDARFDEILSLAFTVTQRAQNAPFAAVCRAIEDRFLDDKLREHLEPGIDRKTCHRYNVIIKVRAALECIDEPQCLIERTELQSVFEKLDIEHKPHLIRFTILYPPDWNPRFNHEHRLSILKWLALIDLAERTRPPGAGQKPVTRKLSDYNHDPSTLNAASIYAAAVDCLAGERSATERYNKAQAACLLSESRLSFDQVYTRPHWRAKIDALLAPVKDSAIGTMDSLLAQCQVVLGLDEAERLCIYEQLIGTVIDTQDDMAHVEFAVPGINDPILQIFHRRQFVEGRFPTIGDRINISSIVSSTLAVTQQNLGIEKSLSSVTDLDLVDSGEGHGHLEI